jgi:hypothetical protein
MLVLILVGEAVMVDKGGFLGRSEAAVAVEGVVPHVHAIVVGFLFLAIGCARRESSPEVQ